LETEAASIFEISFTFSSKRGASLRLNGIQ